MESVNKTSREVEKEICHHCNALSKYSLCKDSERYSFFPIKDKESNKFYNKHVGTMWTNAEMDYSRDIKEFEALSEDKQYTLGIILAFFSSADGIIMNNLAMRFKIEAETLEEKSFYTIQEFMELIHSEAYSWAIDSLIRDEKKKKELFEAADHQPSVIRKNKFMEKYLYSDLERPYRIMAFACAEGIFFISAFFIIFWFRSKNVLANFVFLNEQISKDETLHRDFACHLLRKLKSYMIVDTKLLKEIIEEAVSIEIDFLKEVLVKEESDLTIKDAINYVHCLANDLLISCEEEPIYEQKKLPSWMNDIAMQQKNDTYGRRGGNYRTRPTEENEDYHDFNSSTEDF